MSEFEEDIKKVIKEDGWRDVEFLWKRIMERMGGSYEDAKRVLDEIVAGDRSLRFITVQAKGKVGLIFVTPTGRDLQQKTVIAYHRYLEPDAKYMGNRRGRPPKRRLW